MERYRIGRFNADGLWIFAVADTEKREVLKMFANINDAREYLKEVQYANSNS